MRLPGDRARLAAGRAALLAIVLVAGGAVVALALAGWAGAHSVPDLRDPYLLAVLRFTLWQAALSTVLSVALAVPLALALSDEAVFRGRVFLLGLFGIPLALPALAAALGVLAVFGRSGFVNDGLSVLGLARIEIYGLTGVLIAHVFFNLPLATRILLGALDGIPGEYRRQAAVLGLGRWAWFRLVEWRFLRSSIMGAGALVFTLCLTSFTIVLTLGGGPAATTLEVAIYQALAFDFDPGRAVALTVVQLALAASAFALLAAFGGADGAFGLTLGGRSAAPLRRPQWIRLAGRLTIVLGALFVAAPLMAILADGLVAASPFALLGQETVRRAILTSLLLGSAAALCSVLLGLALLGARECLARQAGAGRGPISWITGPGAGITVAVPPMVIGAGWFVFLRLFADPFGFAAPMVVAVNALMALPFVLRLVRPALDAASERHNRLSAALGLSLVRRLQLVEWPVLRRPLFIAFAFAMALSIGDLGVIALYGSDSVQTLPWLILQRMGSYRTDDAAGLALILCLMTGALMLAAGRAGRQP